MSDFKLDQIQGGSSGLDAFFEKEPQIVTPLGQKVAASAPPKRTKVGSLAQLEGFQRLSSDTLIHKSTQDLWAIKREGNEFFIERLFQDGSPIKG